jgi:small nuclear ribonucleoprotein D3
MTSIVGVPIKLLHESQGHICSIETKQSTLYRGKLIEVEDNMSVQLKEVSMTQRDGRVVGLEQVYLRGSQIR